MHSKYNPCNYLANCTLSCIAYGAVLACHPKWTYKYVAAFLHFVSKGYGYHQYFTWKYITFKNGIGLLWIKMYMHQTKWQFKKTSDTWTQQSLIRCKFNEQMQKSANHEHSAKPQWRKWTAGYWNGEHIPMQKIEIYNLVGNGTLKVLKGNIKNMQFL